MYLVVFAISLLLVLFAFVSTQETDRRSVARENIPYFRPAKLDFKTYKEWSRLLILEKLPYLIDQVYLITMTEDFDKVVNGQDFTLEDLTAALQDFQSTKVIGAFFKACDTDQSLSIDWLEYIVCRGYYDKNGVPHDQTEFDVLENVILNDFKERLNDPRDPMVLELIAKNEL